MKTARWRSAGITKSSSICQLKGEERGDRERNPWLAKMHEVHLTDIYNDIPFFTLFSKYGISVEKSCEIDRTICNEFSIDLIEMKFR